MSDDLSGKVGLDTTDFKRGVTELNASMKSIEAGFRASAAVMGDWSNTSNGLKERISSLNEIYDKQKEKLNILHEEYDKAVASQGEGSKAAESLAGKMFSAEKAISKTQDSIDKYSSQLEKSESPTAGLSDKLGTLGQKVDLSVSKFKVAASGMDDWENKSEGLKAKLQSLSEIAAAQGQKVDTLENVYKKVASAQGEDSQAAQDLAIKLNEEKSALNNTNTDFSKYNEKLKSVEQQEKESTSFLGRFKSAFSGLSDQSQKSTSSISEHLSNLKDTIVGFVSTAVAGLTLKSVIDDTNTADKTMAQMGAVLKSTGGAAGVTQKQLIDLATSQAKVTTFSKGTTEAAENMLLTFTNIKSNVFPQTIKATEDMATAMHMNATQAAMTLGKALNDPAAGLSKLTKQGVTFTEAQKKQITAMEKAGNTECAQKIILQELNKEFGNSAKAAGSTFTGGIQIMTNNLKSAGISIATSLLPIVTNLMPSIVKIANELASTITAHKGEIIGAVTAAAGVVKNIFTFVESHGPLVKGVVIGIASAIGIWKLAMFAANAVNTISNALQTLGIIKTTADTAAKGAEATATSVAATAQTGFNAAMLPTAGIIAGIVAAVALLALGAYELVKHWSSVSGFFKGMWNSIKTATANIWGGIKSSLSLAWNGAIGTGKSVWNGFKGFFISLWNGLVSFVRGLPGKFSSGVKSIGSAIVSGFNSAISFIKSLPSKMLGWGKDMIQGLINGIKSMIGSVGSAVSGIGNKIRSFLHFSTPDEGPLRDYEQWMPDFMGGMAKGITNNTGKLKSAAMNAASALSSGLKANVNIGGASGMSNTSYSTVTNNSSNPIFNITINAAGADVSKQQDMAAMARVLCNQISNQMALATMRRRAAW